MKMLNHDNGIPGYPRKRPRTQHKASQSIFDHGFPYSYKLSSHVSCVNALAFSRNDGRFLASGGDDLNIQLWDFHQENVTTPCHTFVGPLQNIFCLDFSSSNRFLLAGGVDFQVYQYDISRLGSTLTREENRAVGFFREHDCIREITCHPFQDELFIVASDSGRITLHDLRIQPPSIMGRAQDAIQLEVEVTGVQYHPQTEHLFVTSDGQGNVCLRDTRMAFGMRSERSSGNGVVMNYNTKISKRSLKHLSNPESSSVSFNAEGNQIAVTMLHYYPTIYGISDPNPVAICTGRNSPDGTPVPTASERSYSNSCTMKHGCFGGPPDNPGLSYYCAGSDNFCGYLWQIPSVEELAIRREEVAYQDWYREDSQTIGFSKGLESNRYLPLELSTPTTVLKGHNSIVNTTLIHPVLPLIATAGIERDIRLHSPTKSAPFKNEMEISPTEVRRLTEDDDPERTRRAVLGSLFRDAAGYDFERDREEVTTVALFDGILRIEGQADPFEVRRWVPDNADAESGGESESGNEGDSDEED
ncbi:WD40 repeat-like protein [Marasmius fiardii PR-910]|nr:WD40 repeat-like protein [Marasmius fiardii PR-910]